MSDITEKRKISKTNIVDEKAAQISNEVNIVLVEKSVALKEYRDSLVKEKQKSIDKLAAKYDKKINNVDRDLYNLENAAKFAMGSTEFQSLRAQYNKRRRKAKALNKKQANNNDNNNKEVNDNGTS